MKTALFVMIAVMISFGGGSRARASVFKGWIELTNNAYRLVEAPLGYEGRVWNSDEIVAVVTRVLEALYPSDRGSAVVPALTIEDVSFLLPKIYLPFNEAAEIFRQVFGEEKISKLFPTGALKNYFDKFADQRAQDPRKKFAVISLKGDGFHVSFFEKLPPGKSIPTYGITRDPSPSVLNVLGGLLKVPVLTPEDVEYWLPRVDPTKQANRALLAQVFGRKLISEATVVTDWPRSPKELDCGPRFHP